MPHTILIADDDTAILDALTLILEAEGYKVITSLGGRNIEKHLQSHLDLILLDLRMSGRDGISICRELKSNDDTKHIPVVLISAHQDLESIARDCGANSCVRKPFEMDQLIKVIKTILK